MYLFTDTNQGIRTPTFSIKTTFNSVVLEDVLNNEDGNFITLTIKGRGIVNQVHQSANPIGKNGQYFYSKTYDLRTIDLKVKLSGNDNLKIRRQYERLNSILNTDEPSFLSFSDEPNIFYKAQFKESTNEEEISNSIVLTLSFICYDPFKYSDIKTSVGDLIRYNKDFETYPKLTITLSSSGNELKILHVEQQKYIKLNGIYQSNNKIIIDMSKRTITQNGRSILPDLDILRSRFFDFKKGANSLSINIAHSTTSEFSEVTL